VAFPVRLFGSFSGVLFSLRFRLAGCLRRFILSRPEFALLIFAFSLFSVMLFRSPPEDHLTEFFDRDIPPPEQFHEGQNGSEQSLDFLFGAWLQIRSSNLLDQTLDFGGIGSGSLVPLGHC